MKFSVASLAPFFLSLIPGYDLAPVPEIPFDPSLPTIKILGTGGTIASKGATSATTAGYSIGLTIDELVDSIPPLRQIANLEYTQISNVPSTGLEYSHLISIHHNVSHALTSPEYTGVVITHGTDALEETAFFLDLTLNSSKPVCVVGSMRPSTALSADGPMNLYQAVYIAGSTKARDRGTLIVLNDRVASAYYTTKTNANSLDTFKAVEQGYLGTFINNAVYFYYPPVRPTGWHFFDIDDVSDAAVFPEVMILYAHQGLHPELITKAAELGVRGIVLAGTGAGAWTPKGLVEIERIAEKYGITIVQSRRPSDGAVTVGNLVGDYSITSGFLNPQKARIVLQLCLVKGYSMELTREIFNSVFGG